MNPQMTMISISGLPWPEQNIIIRQRFFIPYDTTERTVKPASIPGKDMPILLKNPKNVRNAPGTGWQKEVDPVLGCRLAYDKDHKII
jgi:hypothetical protein